MAKYYPTIGLEIHAELKTATKMFCNSKNDPHEKRSNVNICPVCMGHPGTLPTVNKEAVKHVLKVGVSVGGVIADYSEFDRKNYFYPDIPKGYQISQYQFPLVKGGELASVVLTRVHLEEDTAKSFHVSGEEIEEHSLIDFNRAGVPLMELVTEPVITTSAQAVSDADMEKGGMRVEANISVSPILGTFGNKVEVKNLNSFRSVERAIEYELKRQESVIEEGGEVVQETRGWDEEKGETFSQRKKENSHDYRYFPDPDIPKFLLSEIPEFSVERLQSELPELPWKKRERLIQQYALKPEDSELYVQDSFLAEFFEKVYAGLKDKKFIKLASNYIVSDLVSLQKESVVNPMRLLPENFTELIEMTATGEVSSRGAKDILKVMYEEGGAPRIIAEEKKLFQQSDESFLISVAEKVISANQKVVSEYQKGKGTALQYLIGQCMKETRGSANPAKMQEILSKL